MQIKTFRIIPASDIRHVIETFKYFSQISLIEVMKRLLRWINVKFFLYERKSGSVVGRRDRGR